MSRRTDKDIRGEKLKRDRGESSQRRRLALCPLVRSSEEIGVAIPPIERINGHRCHLSAENRDLSRPRISNCFNGRARLRIYDPTTYWHAEFFRALSSLPFFLNISSSRGSSELCRSLRDLPGKPRSPSFPRISLGISLSVSRRWRIKSVRCKETNDRSSLLVLTL